MRDIKLYIEGMEAHIDQDTSFPITYSLEDITNPTSVENSWSKTVKLPGTPANNGIFGQIWQLDRRTDLEIGGAGIGFNKFKRASFQLYVDNDLFQSGYAKLSKVSNEGGILTYELNLFGGLGEYFYELAEKDLQDLSFGGSSDGGDIPLDPDRPLVPSEKDPTEHVVNRTTVYERMGADKSIVKYMMAYNGMYDKFESGKEIRGGQPVEVGKEMDEHQRRELRSYYQRPALKVSEVFDRINRDSSFDVEKDENFFNDNNPYWSDLYMAMPQYEVSDEAYNGKAEIILSGTNVSFKNGADTKYFENGAVKLENVEGNLWYGLKMKFTLRLEADYDWDPWQGVPALIVTLKEKFCVRADFAGKTFRSGYIYSFGLHPLPSSLLGYDLPIAISFDGSISQKGTYPINLMLESEYGGWIGAITGESMDTKKIEIPFSAQIIPDSSTNANYIEISFNNSIRSESTVDYKKIMPRGTSQKDFILSYCKLFGLIFIKDELRKKIEILSRNTFFSRYRILDWSDRLDYSKPITSNLLPHTSKYYVLAWPDNDTKFVEEYKKKYDRSYGSFTIDTGQQFAAGSKQIYSGIFDNAAMSMEYDSEFKNRNPEFPFRDSKTLPALFSKGSNREKTQVKFPLFFFRGTASLKQTYALTDDTQAMISDNENTYCWIANPSGSDSLTLYSYPIFDRVFKSADGEYYSLDFGKPSETAYPVTDDEYPSHATLYSRFWEQYLRDQYDIDNRLVTAYFHLTPSDVHGFSFNNFVFFENTLWYVCRIVDFDITSTGSTKVELMKVKNVEAYTSGQFFPAPPLQED